MKLPWNRSQEPAAPPSPTDGPALRALEARMLAVEQQLSGLTGSLGLIRVEWAEVLDKINRWASRQAGRLSKQAKDNIEAAGESQDAPGSTNGQGGGVGRLTKADLRRLAYERRSNGGHS